MTRKISWGLSNVRHGKREVLRLGNLDARRDWGFAGDYVRGMWLMLQQPAGDDYVLATGQNHSVREFVERAAEVAGFNLSWQGENEHTAGIDCNTGATIVKVDPELYRPAEVDLLHGDASKARSVLGWKPTVNFEQLVEIMMQVDLDQVAAGRA